MEEKTNIKKGQLLCVAPLRYYLILKTIGIVLSSFVFFAIASALQLLLMTQGNLLVSVFVIVIGVFFLTIVLVPLALTRRVKVYERGLVPAELPYRKLFSIREYFIPYSEVIDIWSPYKRSLSIETKTGEFFEIDSLHVEQSMFEKLLEVKAKFYKATEYGKKVYSIKLGEKDCE